MKTKAAASVIFYSCSKCRLVHVELQDAKDRTFATVDIDFDYFLLMAEGISHEVRDIMLNGKLSASSEVEGHA